MCNFHIPNTCGWVSLSQVRSSITVNFIHRPRTVSGRPVSGVVRPGTQSSSGETIQQMLKTPRTAHTSRPVTSKAARNLRLGTASIVSQLDGPFIQISRLNLAQYALKKGVAKPLFEYIFYHENDIRNVSINHTFLCVSRNRWAPRSIINYQNSYISSFLRYLYARWGCIENTKIFFSFLGTRDII